jgi:hypothetical protein
MKRQLAGLGVCVVFATLGEAQAGPPSRSDTARAGAPAAPPTRDSAAPAVRPARGSKRPEMPKEIVLERETFDYSSGGRRDPYASLMSSSDVRPLISDLKLAVVVLDPVGSNHLVVLRDMFTKRQYRVRVGQQLGRLRVSAIRPRSVVFTVEEFGFNRQETLQLSSDTTRKTRNP